MGGLLQVRYGAWVEEEPNTGDGLIIGLLVEYLIPLLTSERLIFFLPAAGGETVIGLKRNPIEVMD